MFCLFVVCDVVVIGVNCVGGYVLMLIVVFVVNVVDVCVCLICVDVVMG